MLRMDNIGYVQGTMEEALCWSCGMILEQMERT